MRLNLPTSRCRRLLNWLLAVYWIALFIGTHMPVPAGGLPGGSDKLIHFLAYLGLTCLLGIVRGPQKWVSSFVIIAIFAVIDELLQIPVGRSCDVADGLADWLGAATGTGLAAGIERKLS